MPKRILILGVTGVDKQHAMSQLRQWRAAEADAGDLVLVDFEREFIEPRAGSLYGYLDALEMNQRSLWEAAWSDFRSRLPELATKDIVLSLHGTLVRPLYGTRSPVLIDALRDFQPSVIVTLIDDVYAKWHRTERRAGNLDWRGRPTLEQLITARRSEIFLGDLLARNLRPDGALSNYVLAVRHPARTLHRLLFGPQKLARTYWSFPISEPRRMQAAGDLAGINAVDDFLTRGADFERRNPSVCCFCPLMIDELPLIKTAADKGNGEFVDFDLAARWNVRSFWGPDEKLLVDDASLPAQLHLPRQFVRDVAGMIPADVQTRDYRLVMQARQLAVFNPRFNGNESRGVDSEIACATSQTIPVHIFQDPAHDPNGVIRARFKRPAGALGGALGQEYITFHESLDSLFESLRPKSP